MTTVQALSAEATVLDGNRTRIRLWFPGCHRNILPQGASMLGWTSRQEKGLTGEPETVLEWEGEIALDPPACAKRETQN